jgi:regulation of enolase protein 1 (concanavalin A-like superfamily)
LKTKIYHVWVVLLPIMVTLTGLLQIYLQKQKSGLGLATEAPDFLIEFSTDGLEFKQMRIFHLHCLGETTPTLPVRFGLYACSPIVSSFEAVFSDFKLEECLWKAHSTD